MARPTADRRKAEALWTSLHEAFTNAEKVIVQIIETRAWEPLGYKTFADAWNDRLKGMRLPTDTMRAHVVYAMFDSGLDADAIIRATGVGDASVAALARQRSSGVPAGLATTRVRAHDRSNPSSPRFLHVELTPGELDTFKGIAESRGLDVQDEAIKALRKHFRSLERVRTGAR